MAITYSLMGMTCLCCVFLFIMVSYLCVVVKQIRLGLREFLQDSVKYEEMRKRMNSREPLVNSGQSSKESLEPQVVHDRKQERPQGDSERGQAKPLELPNIEHFRARPFSPKPKRSSRKTSDTSKDKNSNPKRTEALDVERTLEKRGRLSSIRALARPVHQSAVNSNTCQLVSYQQRNSEPQRIHQGCLTPNIEDVRMSRGPKMIVNFELVSEDSKSDSDDCFSGKTGVWEIVPESLFSKANQLNYSTIERCGTMDISKI